MPAKPAEGTVGKDNKVFGFSKYDFKVIVRRFGATCAMFQLGTAFAAWRALRTNDVRARKAEMDLRGMQLVDTIFLTLPVATLQAYIGMSCSAPGSACPGREGFDILLFFQFEVIINRRVTVSKFLNLKDNKDPSLVQKSP